MYQLILFDAVDLLDNKGELLLEAKAYFARLRLMGRPQAALITNQGGPACRDADWAWSAKYPTLAEVEAQYGRLAETLGARLYMSLIYLTRQGQVYRPVELAADGPRGRVEWRLPGGGMIRQAMQDHGVERPADGARHMKWAYMGRNSSSPVKKNSMTGFQRLQLAIFLRKSNTHPIGQTQFALCNKPYKKQVITTII